MVVKDVGEEGLEVSPDMCIEFSKVLVQISFYALDTILEIGVI